MSGSEVEWPETLVLKTGQESDKDAAAPGPLMTPEMFSVLIERFSGFSTDLTKLVSELARQATQALDELYKIRSAVDLKKRELKTLHDIEASTDSLKQLTEEHRREKASFEQFMEGRHKAWEEEKSRRAQEEKEHLENLRVRRQHEEEEYRHRRAVEQLKAQQKLEEELRAIQQKGLEKQQALERDCLEREQALKAKELEWIQLIQELEQFMSRLTRRAQSPFAKEPFVQPVSDREEASSPGREKTSQELDPLEGPKPSLASLREMLLSQGRRIETLNAEQPKFAPQNPQNSGSEA